jgi:hypothetical protein
VTRLDLWIFFSTFLSCFFLCIAAIAIATKIVEVRRVRNEQTREIIAMEYLARRPEARVNILPPHFTSYEDHYRNHGDDLNSMMTPIAYQPWRDSGTLPVCVTAFIVQLPGSRYILGVANVRLPPDLHPQRRPTGRRHFLRGNNMAETPL